MATDIIVNTDGGARGNPGPAGVGVIISNNNGKVLKELSKSLGVQTNNWAEYEAVFYGLTELKKMYGIKIKDINVEVRLDSELVGKQLSGEYKIKEESLFSQYIKIHNLMVKDMPNVKFINVPREENIEADKLVNKAMNI